MTVPSFRFFLMAYVLILVLLPLSTPKLLQESSAALSLSDCAVSTTGNLTFNRAVIGNECKIEFTSGTGDWTIPKGVSSFKSLVVGGGGGGGGDSGGGGGGGGVYEGTIELTPSLVDIARITIGTRGLPSVHTAIPASSVVPNSTDYEITRNHNTDSNSDGRVDGKGGYSQIQFQRIGVATESLTVTAEGGDPGQYGSSSYTASGGTGGTVLTSDNSGGISASTAVSQSGATGGPGFNFSSAGSPAAPGSDGVSTSFGTFGGGGGGGASISGNEDKEGRLGGLGGGGRGAGNCCYVFSSTNYVLSWPVAGAANTGGGGGSGAAHGAVNLYTMSGETNRSRNGRSGGLGIVIVQYTPDTTAPSTSLSITPSYLTSGTSISTTLTTNETLSSVTLYYSTSSNLSSPQSCGTTLNPSNGQSLTCTIPATDATYYLYSIGTDLAQNVESAPVSADDSIIRDTTAPTVTNVTSTTNNGSYKAGGSLALQVTFSETPVVTGTPQLTLETGATDRTITYGSSITGTSLIFSYVIQAGDTSADLDYVDENSLSLNGGSIKDAAGNNAILTLPTPGAAGSLSANKALVIDTTAPSLLSATLAASGTSIALAFTENLDAALPATSDFTVTRSLLGGGSETVSVTARSYSFATLTLTTSKIYAGQQVTISYTDPTAGDDANAIQDAAGNDASSFTNVVVTNNSSQSVAQTISITSLGSSSKTYPYSQTLSITTTVTATDGQSGSGTITYAITDGTASGCSLSDTTSATSTITATSFGTCLVTATIAADLTYQSATSASETFTFIQASQSTLTITSTTIAYGQSLSLTTSGGSGTGALTFVVNSGNCSVTSSTLTSTSTGTCSVTATKAADSNYLAESTTATITITTGIATATIAFSSTTLTFGVANPITVTVSTAGSVRFFANGRVIKNCKSISTITGGTITATCNYRPATRRPLTIRARLTPTDTNIAEKVATSAQFLVQRRTGVRG